MKLAIVSPCYNEHEILENSAKQLSDLLDELVKKEKITPDSFILYVNDGSEDDTWDLILKLFSENKYVRGVNLAKNVGHQSAIMAGMMAVKNQCDAVITIDADLQDDLCAIEKMIDYNREGYDIVYGVKTSRQADPFLKKYAALAFYKLQHVFGVKSVYNHADFRLMSNRAICQLSLFKERNLYLRGIVPLIGYKSATVEDIISERVGGTSKYTLKKMLMLAVDGITSFSTRPITLIMGAGFFFLFISIIMSIYVLISFLEYDTMPGWASVMLSIWLTGSSILLAIGVIGQYVGKIYVEVKKRPLYTIEKILNKEGEELKDKEC